VKTTLGPYIIKGANDASNSEVHMAVMLVLLTQGN